MVQKPCLLGNLDDWLAVLPTVDSIIMTQGTKVYDGMADALSSR